MRLLLPQEKVFTPSQCPQPQNRLFLLFLVVPLLIHSSQLRKTEKKNVFIYFMIHQLLRVVFYLVLIMTLTYWKLDQGNRYIAHIVHSTLLVDLKTVFLCFLPFVIHIFLFFFIYFLFCGFILSIKL